MSGRRTAALLALALAAGCEFTIPSGRYACDTTEDCPPGQSCVEGLCVRPVDAGEHPDADAGRADAGMDAGREDAGMDAGREDGGRADAGADAGMDAGMDAGPGDAGPRDAGVCGIELVHTETAVRPAAFAWADVDGDGDDDLVAGFDTVPAAVYRNDGGRGLSRVWVEPAGGYCGVPGFGDVDGDGYPELAVGHCDASSGGYRGYVQVFGNRSGTLSSSPIFRSEIGLWVVSVAWGDADGDGLSDLFVGTLTNLSPASRIYRSDGTTLAATPLWVDPTRYRASRADVFDVDGDGDGDLLLNADRQRTGTGPEGDYLLRNEGGGTFARAWGVGGPGTAPRGWALGDVDSDGDVDVITHTHGSQLDLYLNDGSGFSATPTPIGTSSGITRDMELGDVDGDGDLDLAIARTGAADEVWFGDGAGGFTLGWSSVSEVETHEDAAWIDWDGDGARDDLAFGSRAAPLRVYRWVCR